MTTATIGHYCDRCKRVWQHKGCKVYRQVADVCAECSAGGGPGGHILALNELNRDRHYGDWWYADEFAEWVKEARAKAGL